MNWKDYSDRMSRYVIKKDGTAVDNEYFMATHVPFRKLELIESGDTESESVNLTEEEIYDKYILNRSNRHQMIIVRGDNGTGKSHLICWLHNRFVSDEENYNPNAEKVIFLRRLENTVKGAMQQILDDGIVQDNELREKFERFCNADKSQSKEEYKTSIYSEYVNKVATDSTDPDPKKFPKKILRSDIASFLHDSRVQKYMMRSGGPVEKCYQLITGGAQKQKIFTDETEEKDTDETREKDTDEADLIFKNQDFDFPRDVRREINNSAAEEVKNYYRDELSEDGAITKLVSYLNHFTSRVMQSCANITSENARDLFVNLRKSLHKEGKNLTIFIEDFTSFSIMQSGLITALAVENGGEYNDLCRVNSVIGITDAYYTSFLDNFKDRVTIQIKVTEQSFSDKNFLLELAARYLNATYSTREQIVQWYQNNRANGSLPDPVFTPNMEWDYVEIDGKKYTLYPFNKKSLIVLYGGERFYTQNTLNNSKTIPDRGLKNKKTPRNYLSKIIHPLFIQFADGMVYGNNLTFPEITDINYDKLKPPYADNIENTGLSDIDKQRLKILFQIWGNGKTDVSNGKIGGIPAEFLKQIGLADFQGTGSSDVSNPTMAPNVPQPAIARKPDENKPSINTHQLTQKDIDFSRRKDDIESWFDEKKTLEYSSDFNKWVGSFVAQAIDWQGEGLPGEFVITRLKSGSFVYIEDSKQDTKNRAAVILKRSSESRTILMGLALFNSYNHSWDFDNAPYYQLVMINWIEHSKQEIINNIFGDSIGTKEHQVITWCIAAEYIERLLSGENLDKLSTGKLLQHIFGNLKDNQVYRTNDDWNDVLTYLHHQKAMQEQIHDYMKRGSNTLMGVVGDASSGKVKFFRTAELFNSIEHLKNAGWDISSELQNPTVKFFDSIRTFLIGLYTKVQAVTDREKSLSEGTIKKFEDLIGTDPTEQDYINAVNWISKFLVTCSTAHDPSSRTFQSWVDEPPAEDQARNAITLYQTLKKAVQSNNRMELLLVFSKAPREKLDEINSVLSKIEAFAKTLQAKHSKLLGNVKEIDPLFLEGTLTKLEQLSNTISSMETK